MQAQAIARVLVNQRYDYQLGHVDDELAGVVAVRDHAHLSHLFVAAKWQGRDFGRLLICRCVSGLVGASLLRKHES